MIENIFRYHLFFLLFIISNILNNSFSVIDTGQYPYISRLKNGNYIILSSYKIIFADPTLTTELNVKYFTSLFYSLDYSNSLAVAQYKIIDNGYIIALVYNKIFIFSSDGEFYSELEDSNIDSKTTCSIIPKNHIDNNYYFVIILANANGGSMANSLLFINYIFDSTTNITTTNGNNIFTPFQDQIFYSTTSCELMKNNSQEYIVCLYGNSNIFRVTVFNKDDYSVVATQEDTIGGQYFKCAILPNKREQGIFCGFKSGQSLYCINYDITRNIFYNKTKINNSGCSSKPTSLTVQYFYETERMLIGCHGNSNKYYLSQTSKELDYIETNIEYSSPTAERLNIILPEGQGDYTFFGQNIQTSMNTNIEIINQYPIWDEDDVLVCTESQYYSYNRSICLESIPDGYYCNSTTERTIDRCHENCKTCNEGPTTNNNNCLKCQDTGKEYFDWGNCLSELECENGVLIDNLIKKCKCISNNKCLLCNSTSSLCLGCNNDAGYYARSNDINEFVECYNSKPDGYYLNELTHLYESCYSKCQTCNQLGNDENNECIICKSEYSLIKNKNGIENCYRTCSNYYYFDTGNNYVCLSNNECPEGYKLIYSTNRCIDNCINDNIYNYNYEYNNVCYEECPRNTYISDEINKICEAELICDFYYNYEHTGCISDIPEGFYCNNSELQTIDKCHINCKTCEIGGTDEYNNCISCKEEGAIYFDLGNCREICPHGFFIDNSIKKCKCTSNISCHYCTEESMRENLCESCNIDEGYYPKSDDIERVDGFVNCYKNLEGYFLMDNVYKPCYLSCKSCAGPGNVLDNNCTECLPTYETKNDFDNDNNCYQKCPHYYYYDLNNNYSCTEDNNCPPEYSKLIGPKKRCIDECKNDNIYRYEYLNECYNKCPLGTESSNNDTYLCKEKIIEEIEENKERCKIAKKEFIMNEITVNNINNLTVDYVNQYGSSSDYVSKQESNVYIIYIYKDINCLKKTADEAPQIEFGGCYEKIKNHYNISDELIITLINKNEDNMLNPSTSFYFSNPLNGKILNVSEICADEKIVIHEDVLSLIEQLDDQKEEFIMFLTKQGIDVFNISDQFYNDLCFPYESPNGKDVPMKDRISAFYPNVTLCDKGCENKGVDLNSMKAKCECIFDTSFMGNDILMDNFYGQAIAEVMDIISSLNIAVMQCIRQIFIEDQFLKCTGGFIIMGLFSGQLICVFKYLFDGLYDIRKFFFSLTSNYDTYVKKNPLYLINFPPKKRIKKKKAKLNGQYNVQISENNILGKKSKEIIIGSSSTISSNINSKNKINLINDKNLKKSQKILPINKQNNNEQKNIHSELTNPDIDIIKDFLSDSFDERDFDDVLDKDKRTFCLYFFEIFKNNQIFINSFCIIETLKPRPLKLLILIITIELYFVITALFYNEEYLSELFNSSEKDSFFSFVPRRVNQFIYTSAVSGIISYLIGYFFIEEGKIKRIFRRNKEDSLKIKYEISQLMKNIEKKFMILLFFSIILSIVCFVYIACFNIVYPYIRFEWIKSSIFILILMQALNLLFSFIHCCLRYLGVCCNNEKIFELSLFLA